MGHDGVCLNKRYHASIHDKRPGVKEEYAKFYQDNWRWDRFDADLPKVHKMQNPNLVVWETHASNTSSSLWTPTDASHYATGPGWDAPPNPSIMPTRTLVGKYGFYTSWFTGHYGHFNHDFLPTLAYMRKVAMTAYGDETRFILVEFWRSKEVVKFMDPVFYERIDWISDNEVVKIEGEVTYIEPLSIPEIAGHALMAYLREWMVEAHPFDQADFDANKHVLYYDRVGSSGVNHGRVLDADHQKEIIIAIRKSMDKHGLGDQELVLFNGQNENGEALSPEEQFLAFRRASTLIGPHGTGFSNMVWTNPNPKFVKHAHMYWSLYLGRIQHMYNANTVDTTAPYEDFRWIIMKFFISFHQRMQRRSSAFQSWRVHWMICGVANRSFMSSPEFNPSLNQCSTSCAQSVSAIV